MTEIYVVSDTHFNHANILKFTGEDGKTFRNFRDVHEMNETMIENWNKVVTPQDKVYHLGDVFFGNEKEAEVILSRLNGKKRLIVGNHDHLKSPVLHKYFQKIYMWRIFKEYGLLLTHVPVHEGSIRGGGINVHGHIHQNTSPKGPYKCVCVEHTNYTPVNIEGLR